MRIIAGSARGRRFRAPRSGVRPTSDRVREAVFSILETYIDDWSQESVLDLYAGSGSLGLEALSRGAGRALFVEVDGATASLLRQNCDSLQLGGEVLRGRAEQIGPGPMASLVFLDPPYDTPNEVVSDVITNLVANGRVADGSLVVLERGVGGFSWNPEFTALTDKQYGTTRIRIAVLRGDSGSMATSGKEDA